MQRLLNAQQASASECTMQDVVILAVVEPQHVLRLLAELAQMR